MFGIMKNEKKLKKMLYDNKKLYSERIFLDINSNFWGGGGQESE